MIPSKKKKKKNRSLLIYSSFLEHHRFIQSLLYKIKHITRRQHFGDTQTIQSEVTRMLESISVEEPFVSFTISGN